MRKTTLGIKFTEKERKEFREAAAEWAKKSDKKIIKSRHQNANEFLSYLIQEHLKDLELENEERKKENYWIPEADIAILKYFEKSNGESREKVIMKLLEMEKK